MRIFLCLRLWLFALAVVLILQFGPQARAQSYPDKPIHIIVGVSPGGGVDIIARVLAQQLSTILGQPVVVENRVGAAGMIANGFVARSPADGYTLLFTSDDLAVLSAFHSDLPYDLLRDLLPVSLVAETTTVLVVTPSLPVHNVKEFIALAKSEPGKLTYGSAGVGTTIHLQDALFASMAGIDMVHVPYKGSAGAVVGVAQGEVDMTFASVPAGRALTKAGKLKALAVATPHRWPLLPSLPTISESGVPGFSYTDWYGLSAPAGLPKNVLAVLSAGVAKAVSSPEMKAALAKQGAVAQTDSPAQFAALVRSDLAAKAKIVKMAGLKAE